MTTLPLETHTTTIGRKPGVFRIRPARRDDMSRIADFVRSSADWYRPFVHEDDMAEHDVDEAWAEENYCKRDFFIGCLGDEPIGTISLQQFGDWIYLGYIYLDVAHVGNGYGQVLMQFAERRARELQSRGLALIAHPEASWAKKAYLKYGFEIVASEPQEVLAWEGGALQPYYEQDFELYLYDFDDAESDG